MEFTGKIEITDTNSHGDYYIGNKDNYIAIVVMDVLSSEDIAKANAKEIVRRWNAFEDGGIVEELKVACEVGLDAIKALLKVDIKFNTKNNKSLKEIIEFVEAALAKS